jgi:hypothetical protein
LTTRAPTRNGNVIERCSGRLKGFRRIATRYHKLARRKLLSALCLVAIVAYWLYNLVHRPHSRAREGRKGLVGFIGSMMMLPGMRSVLVMPTLLFVDVMGSSADKVAKRGGLAPWQSGGTNFAAPVEE